jgi:hypothetical protein
MSALVVRRYDRIPFMRLGILMSLMSLLVCGCTLQVTPPVSLPSSGTILYKEDFSSPLSGWDHTQYEEGIMDYDRGGYRILVNAPDLNFWATPHKDFTDTRTEVDTGKLAGPDENRIGLLCRSDGRNYYFFIITSDGYYGLGLFKDGKAKLLGQQQMQASTAIHTGLAVNHLRSDCQGDQLTLFVNGFQLTQAHDPALKHGDVGILAGTFKQTGADIVFDNFVVFAP